MKNNTTGFNTGEKIAELLTFSIISWKEFVEVAGKVNYPSDFYFSVRGYAECNPLEGELRDAYLFVILTAGVPQVCQLHTVFEGLSSSKRHVQVLAKRLGEKLIDHESESIALSDLIPLVDPASKKYIQNDCFCRDTIRHWLLDYFPQHVTLDMLEAWGTVTDLELKAKIDMHSARIGFELSGPHAARGYRIIERFSMSSAA